MTRTILEVKAGTWEPPGANWGGRDIKGNLEMGLLEIISKIKNPPPVVFSWILFQNPPVVVIVQLVDIG